MRAELAVGLWAIASMMAAPAGAQVASCPVGEPSWCDRTEAGADGLLGTADDRPGCVAAARSGSATACSVSEATTWHFAEDPECAECAHVLYAQIAAGDEIRLVIRHEPTGDATAPLGPPPSLRVRATSLATSADLVVSAENECTWRASWPPTDPYEGGPFVYCETCAEDGGFVGRDLYRLVPPSVHKNPGNCVYGITSELYRGREVPCLRWSASGTEIAWGPPLDADGDGDFDEDDDGSVDAVGSPPCAPCVMPDCACGATTDANPVFGDQAILVRIPVPPIEPRVVRIELVGGGGAWTLSSICGEPDEAGIEHPGPPLHATCDAALAAHAAAPSLPLVSFPSPSEGLRILDSSGCPWSVVAAATACNSGSSPAPFVFVRAVWGGPTDPGYEFDMTGAAWITDPACVGPLAPGECRTCVAELALEGGAAITAYLLTWPDGDEADERVPVLGCASGPDSTRITACTDGPCTAHVRPLATMAPRACIGEAVGIEAWRSQMSGCASYEEYRLESPPGTALSDWEGPLLVDLPDSAGVRSYWVRMRCAADPACEALLGPVDVEILPTPVPASSVVAVPLDDCRIGLTWDAAISSIPATYSIGRDTVTPIVSGLTPTSWVDEDPPPGLHQYFVMTEAGCYQPLRAAASNAAARGPDITPPSFTGIEAAIPLSGCLIRVEWDPSDAIDACSAIAGFNVYRDVDVASRGTTLVASGLAGSPFEDVPPGNGTWTYVVRAVDAVGNEDPNDTWEQADSATCIRRFPSAASMDGESGMESPGPTLNVRGGLGDGLTIRWQPSDDEGRPYPVTYDVVRGTLASLSRSGYDHAPIGPDSSGLTGHEHVAMGQDDGIDSYYLIVATSGDNANVGADSSGRAIPER